MCLRNVRIVMTVAAVVTAIATSGFVLVRSEIGRPNNVTGRPRHVGSPPARSRKVQESQGIVLASLKAMDVAITQRYDCKIHSQRHINVRALADGQLNEISVKDGQAVKKGDLMFKIAPGVDRTKFDAETAKVQLAQLKLNNGIELFEKNEASKNEVARLRANLARALAEAQLAKDELNSSGLRAPFDGMVDHVSAHQGSFVKDGDTLATLSDNSVMWVFFNVNKDHYPDYMSNQQQHEGDTIELVLANGNKFPQTGKIGVIGANFDIETGNIPCRADFPNPDRLLRHGQTGTVLVTRTLKDAIVIPERATYENLDKRYVYVVDQDAVAHRREIVVQNEIDDKLVINQGVGVGDRIVLEGIRQVRDGEKVEYEVRSQRKAQSREAHLNAQPSISWGLGSDAPATRQP
jgi:membrane fusion protein (multidrug efflux system)